MKIIRSTKELLALLDESGKVREPVTLAEWCRLSDLGFIISLKGVTFADTLKKHLCPSPLMCHQYKEIYQ